jgi:hypothetical protein
MGANEDIQKFAQELVTKNLAAAEGQVEEQPSEDTEEVVEESQSEEEAQEQQDLIELKAVGETHQYTLDQIKELASKGLDYTRKTQELSERAKSEADKIVLERTSALEIERKRLFDAVDNIEGMYGRPFVTQEQLDQLIHEGDTDTYLKLSRQEEKRKEILANARSERQRLQDEKAKADAEQFNKDAINHTQILFDKMPELKDKGNQEKLAQYLAKAGLTPKEISKFIDHRGLILAEKARRYDELSGGKLEAVKKDPPKVIKKVGATVNKQTYTEKDIDAAKAKLSQSGNLRDAAALMLKLRK